ncbi:hypothetical protein A6A07_11065 [Streptomyces sp. CB03911]|nr:hypothetical protein A6A07_11065 [Streptomyces sp. CB03911]
MPKGPPPGLAPSPWASNNGPLLTLLADALDDLERTRIANQNRLRQLTRTEADSDGEERGFGLTLDMPQVAAVAGIVDALAKLEHDATLNLQRALRKHPLGPWVKTAVGVGEKQGARLIAAIGDPYWNTLHNRPRTVSELWAYCGLHVLPSGSAPARARGQRANWSATAKMRVYLIAESCVKKRGPACRDLDGKHADGCTCSPYRRTYDGGRLKYADAIHVHDCRRCGPAGKPAPAGTPLSAGHQHARAIRLAMKEVLKDLWLESKRLHEGT